MTAEKIKDFLREKLTGAPTVFVNAVDDSVKQCIGVYDPRAQEKRRRCIGAKENTKHQVKAFQILVHWTDSPVLSEAKAKEVMSLFDHKSNFEVSDIPVIASEAEYPRWAGRAQNRVCEYIVPIKITYKEVKNNA